MTKQLITVRFSNDYGCEITQSERDRYSDLLAEAISSAYPAAQVIVTEDLCQGTKVMTNIVDNDGWPVETACQDIARAVWDAGEFWK